jgi:DNA-binding response OmpR family regulator
MAERKRVLVIDDQPFILSLVHDSLEAAGYDVITAKNLAELDRQVHLRTGKPNLVLVDVQMPDILGDDVALMIMTMRRFSAPIFLMSAMDESELKERAEKIGASGYICKTRGIMELVKRVKEILGPPEEPEQSARP